MKNLFFIFLEKMSIIILVKKIFLNVYEKNNLCDKMYIALKIVIKTNLFVFYFAN